MLSAGGSDTMTTKWNLIDAWAASFEDQISSDFPSDVDETKWEQAKGGRAGVQGSYEYKSVDRNV